MERERGLVPAGSVPRVDERFPQTLSLTFLSFLAVGLIAILPLFNSLACWRHMPTTSYTLPPTLSSP